MSDDYKQQRPSWCPHPTCKFLVNTQEMACMGELPTPEKHGGGENTHRLCIHGAKDDGEWTFDLMVNRGDMWSLWRIIGSVFKFNREGA